MHHRHTGASPGKGNPASIPYGPRTGLPMIKWTLPITPRLNPVQDLSGHASHGILGFGILPVFLRLGPMMHIPYGPQVGFVRAWAGSLGYKINFEQGPAGQAETYQSHLDHGMGSIGQSGLKFHRLPRLGWDRADWACPLKSLPGFGQGRHLAWCQKEFFCSSRGLRIPAIHDVWPDISHFDSNLMILPIVATWHIMLPAPNLRIRWIGVPWIHLCQYPKNANFLLILWSCIANILNILFCTLRSIKGWAKIRLHNSYYPPLIFPAFFLIFCALYLLL